MLRFILILLITVSALSAQSAEYVHSELTWKTFETDHFVIHYHSGTRFTATTIAGIAERIHQPLVDLYRYQPGRKIHFIIRDVDDYSNGGAYFFDDKVEIWASNLDYIMRGTKNWLQDVVTHEYTHMISIQSMIKTSRLVPYGFFQWFGYEKERRKDVVRGFPNSVVSYPISSIQIPVWYAEGTAQHQVDGQRHDYRDPHREMILRDRVLTGNLLEYDAMSVFGKNSHGNESAYNQGFAFVNYLTDRFGEDVLAKISAASRKWNTLSFSGVLEIATGSPADELYRDWKTGLEQRYARQTEAIRAHEIKGSSLALEGDANLYPVWSPDGRQVAWVSNKGEDYFSFNRLYLREMESGREKILAEQVSSSLSWSPDGRFIAYARREANRFGSLFNDLFLYDLQEEKEIRLTKNLRGNNPDFSPDGKSLVFVTAANGRHQLNVLRLASLPAQPEWKKVWFDVESGVLNPAGSDDPNFFRTVEYLGESIGQLLVFSDSRQIFHPRWMPDGQRIVFDTATDYGRNLAMYSFGTGSYREILSGKPEYRYPFPQGRYIYYAGSQTGIYNIYRLDEQTGQSEMLTNVTGGAMMPSVRPDGQMLYGLYENAGYRIYQLASPENIDPQLAVYDPEYPANVPEADWPAAADSMPAGKKYRPAYTGVHILPRLLVDYGTVKPGFYVFNSDVLDKTSLIFGAAANKDLEYDLYGNMTVNDLAGKHFYVEAYNSSARITDTLSITIGEQRSLRFSREVDFNLIEARLGSWYMLSRKIRFDLAWIYRRYSALLHLATATDPISGQKQSISEFRYNYLKGQALEWSALLDFVAADRNQEINPSGGRYVYFRHSLESNDFLDGFSTANQYGLEKYKNYTFNQFYLDWEEYGKNPLWKSHGLALRLRAGYIDRPVDSFFNLFAGGLIGMRGYSFYSIEGRHKLIGSVSYRFPLLQDINKSLLHINLDKIYFGFFADYGNAWSEKKVSPGDFKRDVGMQLRLETFSFYLFPTRFFLEAAYPLDIVRHGDIRYDREWRYYFGALFDFDLRERISPFRKHF